VLLHTAGTFAPRRLLLGGGGVGTQSNNSDNDDANEFAAYANLLAVLLPLLKKALTVKDVNRSSCVASLYYTNPLIQLFVSDDAAIGFGRLTRHWTIGLTAARRPS
jgi:hypothetical protein